MMKANKLCKYCGSVSDVFSEHTDSGVENICIRCKNNQIEISKNNRGIEDMRMWESKLNLLETEISEQIIELTFSRIKFKKFAILKLAGLMNKYPIREVFETCMVLKDNDFSLPKIERECKDKIEVNILKKYQRINC